MKAELTNFLVREEPITKPRLEQPALSIEGGNDGEPSEASASIPSERSNQSFESNRVTEEIDNSLLQPTFGKEWSVLPFEDAAKFVMYFSKNILEGKVTLYPWQVEELVRLSEARPTQQEPFKYALCACNGSGKDLYFNSVIALFLICCKIRFRVIITSSSANQLDKQTETHIVSLATQINDAMKAIYGAPILKINQHKITCLLSGSEIILFVTDEEGKAEGWHPFDGGDMAIIVNEAKTVTPDIFRALRRCTGYSYFLLVSSPGVPHGDFHFAFVNWKNKRRITIFDCPHHSRAEFEEDKIRLGESNDYFRSKWLAAFTDIEGKNIISLDKLNRMAENSKQNRIKEIFSNKPLKVGIDIALSDNGDESVISVWRGNRHIHQFKHRIKDATILADKLEEDLLSIGLAKEHEDIRADDGGVGRAVIDILRRKGWINIQRVLNQSQASNTRQYRNRGAEMWQKFNRLVEAGCLILLDDQKLRQQLASRKYKSSLAGVDKLCLQPKKEAIAEGIDSPDRADAAVLALANVDVLEWLDEYELTRVLPTPKTKKQQWEDIEEKLLRGGDLDVRRSDTPAYGSVNVVLSRMRQKTKYLIGA